VALFVFVVDTAFTVYYWILIARIILSWLPMLNDNRSLRPVIAFVHEITEPFLGLFRRIIPSVVLGGAGFDFSPFIAIITLVVLQSFTHNLLLFLF